MAEEELKLEDKEESSSGGNMKMLIIIAVACLALGGGIGAGIFLFLKGGEEPPPEQAEEVVEAEPEIDPQYVVLKPEFIVSFQVGTRQRYLQTSIEVLTRYQSVVDALSMHEPMIRNNIIRVIGAQDFNRLRTNEGRLELQEKIKLSLEELLKEVSVEGDIKAILFTNLVMQ